MPRKKLKKKNSHLFAPEKQLDYRKPPNFISNMTMDLIKTMYMPETVEEYYLVEMEYQTAYGFPWRERRIMSQEELNNFPQSYPRTQLKHVEKIGETRTTFLFMK